MLLFLTEWRPAQVASSLSLGVGLSKRIFMVKAIVEAVEKYGELVAGPEVK